MDDPGPTGIFLMNSLMKPISVADAPEIVIYVILLILCLLISAICSSSENAFFSHRDSDTELLKEEKSKTGRLILDLLDRPKQLLATMLLLNSLVNVAFVLIAILLTEKVFDLEALPWLKFFVEAIVVTVVILVFGEVVPKVFATQNYQLAARYLVYPMRMFVWFCSPFTYLLVKFGALLER